MKTVFITIFEGVESKNILRTGIVDKMLSNNPELRVVLFVKNESRMDHYQKEFNHPRIVYEIAKPYEPNRLNRFFGRRKFHFLQTDTTDLRAKIIAQDRGRLYYYYTLLLHRILARSFFVKIFRFLDLVLVKDAYFDKYFEKYKPNLIFLANLFEDFEANFLRSAKKHAVFSIGLINSWDRVTARCILRILPDKFVVFNSVIKQEVVDANYVKPEDIFVSGLPQYDYYFSPVNFSRKDFLDKLGIEDESRVMFYSPIGGMFSNSDWEMIDLLYDLNNRGKFGEQVKIFVSFPPNDFIKEEELEKRPWLLYQYLGTRFSNVRSTDWDMTKKELDNLKSLLFHASLIVCYASSLSMDAAVFDKPAININFEIKNNGNLSKSPTVFYKMTHYKKALGAGGIRLVDNEEELIHWVRKYLEDPSVDREGRKKLVQRQCEYTDGKSAERIALYLNKFI
ncbi:MAG: CDP-glycerol glycerophosphotransferase family protein [Candidatus Zambryskibacteria bacterium]|nr:CDP-glycerol glycerophosphotransferase family protein [Candidatus Zambryskibacteria bacterium]